LSFTNPKNGNLKTYAKNPKDKANPRDEIKEKVQIQIISKIENLWSQMKRFF
jgi:hypothetical protein